MSYHTSSSVRPNLKISVLKNTTRKSVHSIRMSVYIHVHVYRYVCRYMYVHVGCEYSYQWRLCHQPEENEEILKEKRNALPPVRKPRWTGVAWRM